MATPQPKAPEAHTALLGLYERADEAVVAAFLSQHPEAVAALVEAVPHLRAEFGDRAVLRLELPHFDDAPLFARVYRHGLAATTALEHIEHFDSAWWQAQPYESRRHWVEFDVGWG